MLMSKHGLAGSNRLRTARKLLKEAPTTTFCLAAKELWVGLFGGKQTRRLVERAVAGH